MLTRNLVRLIVFLLSICAGVGGLQAATITPDIQIEGQKNPSPIAKQYTQAGGWGVKHSNGTTFTCPTGTSNKYTISGNAIRTGDDSSSPDHIIFHDTTIKADSDNVCGRIYFWKKVIPGPSGIVDFDLFFNGSLKRGAGAAIDSWVHISGWVQEPATTQGETDGVSGTWEHVGSLSGPSGTTGTAPALDRHPNALTFSWNNSIDENPDLTGIYSARIMKGEIWFFLKQTNDQLILNNGTGVKVQTAAGGGGGGVDGGGGFDPDKLDIINDLSRAQLHERLERIEKKLGLPPLPPLPPKKENE
jgi:hypothetical protein